MQLNCFANGSVCRPQSDYHITNSIAHHGAFHGEDKVREFLCTLSKTIKILPHYSYVPVLTGMQQERTKETSKAAREGREKSATSCTSKLHSSRSRSPSSPTPREPSQALPINQVHAWPQSLSIHIPSQCHRLGSFQVSMGTHEDRGARYFSRGQASRKDYIYPLSRRASAVLRDPKWRGANSNCLSSQRRR